MKKLIALLFLISLSHCQINFPDAQAYIDKYTTKTMPGIPVITANPGINQVTFVWSACTDTSSYNLSYSTTSGTYSFSILGVTSPYTLTGLTNDTIYYVKLTAINSNGQTDSSEISAMSGVRDNMDSTIYIASQNLTWSKCNQTSLTGADSYNPLLNDCSNGTAMTFQVCDIDYYCDGLITDTLSRYYGQDILNPITMATWGTTSQVYTTCNNKTGFRVPTMTELEQFKMYFNQNRNLWPNLANGYYWSGTGYLDMPQYGSGQVSYNPYDGSWVNQVPMKNGYNYVICVK